MIPPSILPCLHDVFLFLEWTVSFLREARRSLKERERGELCFWSKHGHVIQSLACGRSIVDQDGKLVSSGARSTNRVLLAPLC